jgi:hypothetical protein
MVDNSHLGKVSMDSAALDINGTIVVRIREVEDVEVVGSCETRLHPDRRSRRTMSYNIHVVHRTVLPSSYTAYIDSIWLFDHRT